MFKQTPLYQPDTTATVTDGWQAAAPVRLAGATLSDHSTRGKLLIQGAGAPALLRRGWQAPALSPTTGTTLALGYAFCLRPGRYFLSLPPGEAAAILTALQEAWQEEDGPITITDVTHGRAEIWLQGPAAVHLLSHLCGLDFHPDLFPDLGAQESSVARTHQLILRHDQEGERAYALVGPRSLGLYLWQVIIGIGDRGSETGRPAANPQSPAPNPYPT